MANRRKLSDSFVAAVRCPADKASIEITDAATTGLTLWVGRTGTKLFKFRSAVGGKTVRQTLGEFDPKSFGVEQAREAARLADERRKTDGAPIDPQSQLTGIDDVLDYYLTRVSPATARSVSSVTREFREQFGKWHIGRLTAADVRIWIEERYEHRKGAASVLVRYLSAAFNYAASSASGLRMPPNYTNPLKGIRRDIRWWGKHRPKSHSMAFEADDYTRLFRAIKAAYAQTRTTAGIRIVHLLATTGARPSEIAGLLVSELNLDSPSPHILKATHKMERRGGPRVIRLSDQAVKILREQLQENENRRLNKSPYVFPLASRRKNQKKPHISTITHYMKIVADEAGMEITPYSLRGAYISYTLDTMGDGYLTTVAENVGHADPTVTLKHYRRHTESRKDEVANTMGTKLADLYERA